MRSSGASTIVSIFLRFPVHHALRHHHAQAGEKRKKNDDEESKGMEGLAARAGVL